MAVGLLGATGLVGSGAQAALESPIVRFGRGPAADRALDLSEPDSFVPGLWAGLDCLVHCAGVTDEEFQTEPEAAYRRSTYAMARLVDSVCRAGIARFVYVSTAHVYGPLEGEIGETQPVDPRTDYAIAHYAAEQILRRAGLQQGLDALILRPCAVYGFPSDLGRFQRFGLIPFAFPKMAVEQGRITLQSPGDQIRNFISARMIGERIKAYLRMPPEQGRVLIENPLGPDDLSVVDFAQLCGDRYRRLTGSSCPVSRPEGQGMAPPFFYCSLRDDRDKPSELTPFIDQLIAFLRS